MVPLTDSYLPRLLQTFIIEIALLICFPSFCSPYFFQNFELDLKSCSLKIGHTFICPLSVALVWMCVYLTMGIETLQAKIKHPYDTSDNYTHLLCDTDGDGRAAGVLRGQCALSSPATWQRPPSCCKEVSPPICVNEVTTLQGQATTRTHTLHSSADIC